MSRDSKFLLWIALITGAILLAIASLPSADKRLEGTKSRVAALLEEARSRRLPRSVRQEPAKPGRAWDEYDLAMRDPKPWNRDPNGRMLRDFVSGKPVDRVTVEQVSTAGHANLDHLRLGAQREDGQFPYAWERGMETSFPSMLSIRRLASLAAAQSIIAAEAGRTEEAADLLQDLSIFARDVSANSPLLPAMIGLDVYTTAADGFRYLVLSGKLKPKDFAHLAEQLEGVGRDFPSLSPAIANETMSFGMMALEVSTGGVPAGDWVGVMVGGGWRYGFSLKRMAIDSFELRASLLERFLQLDRLDYASARRESDAMNAVASASTNPLIPASIPNFSHLLENHREALARLRMLQAAAIFRATGKMPAIADPFGVNLFFAEQPGKLVIWSVGSDGTNQNGKGDWDSSHQPDIVLEIPRVTN